MISPTVGTESFDLEIHVRFTRYNGVLWMIKGQAGENDEQLLYLNQNQGSVSGKSKNL